MSGGNSHQRAVERATKARTSEQSPEPPSHMEGPQPPEKRIANISAHITTSKVSKPKHHGFEFLLVAVTLAIEFLAIFFGVYWLSVGAAVFLWLAIYNYCKNWANVNLTRARRIGIHVGSALMSAALLVGIPYGYKYFTRQHYDSIPTSDIVAELFNVILPFETDKPVYINLVYRNDATYNLHVTMSYMVLGANAQSEVSAEYQQEEKYWQEFLTTYDKKSPFNVSAKATNFTTLIGPILPKEYADALNLGNAGGAVLYFMGIFRYFDSSGHPHELDFCHMTRGVPIVIFNCNNHNGPVKPT